MQRKTLTRRNVAIISSWKIICKLHIHIVVKRENSVAPVEKQLDKDSVENA